MKKLLLSILTIASIAASAQVVYVNAPDTLDQASASGNEEYRMAPSDHTSGLEPVIFQSQMGGGTFNVQILLSTANDGGVELCYPIAGLMSFPMALDSGIILGPNTTWLDGPFPNGGTAFTLYHQTISPQVDQQTGCDTSVLRNGADHQYVGLRFASNGSDIHYGWAEISINAGGTDVIIHGWAYETTLNAPIMTGNTNSLVSQITVTGAGGATSINTSGGTLQMIATLTPSTNLIDSTVTWSVKDSTGSATIDANGLLTSVSNGIVVVTATANDGAGTSGSANITLQSGAAGVALADNEEMSIYPNPANNFFLVQSQSRIRKVEMYDMVGALVREVESTGKNVTIDVSDETNGIYFVKVYAVNGTYTQRVIIK